jgi:hypothetical protein
MNRSTTSASATARATTLDRTACRSPMDRQTWPILPDRRCPRPGTTHHHPRDRCRAAARPSASDRWDRCTGKSDKLDAPPPHRSDTVVRSWTAPAHPPREHRRWRRTIRRFRIGRWPERGAGGKPNERCAIGSHRRTTWWRRSDRVAVHLSCRSPAIESNRDRQRSGTVAAGRDRRRPDRCRSRWCSVTELRSSRRQRGGRGVGAPRSARSSGSARRCASCSRSSSGSHRPTRPC